MAAEQGQPRASMSIKDLYLGKRMSAADAVGLVRDGDFIIVPTGAGEPPTLLTALSDKRLELHDVKVAQMLAVRKYAYIDPATVDHVRHVALFCGAATRAGGQEGWIDYIPNCFWELPRQIERGLIPADVVFSIASAMDGHGYFAVSLAADYTMAALAKARVVVLEVNPDVPFAFGNCHVHLSQVSALVESSEPLFRARGQPLARRQGLHRASVDRQGRKHLAHRCDPHVRHPYQAANG